LYCSCWLFAVAAAAADDDDERGKYKTKQTKKKVK
jgi:hypothetical protein